MSDYTATYSNEQTRDGKFESSVIIKKKGTATEVARFSVIGYADEAERTVMVGNRIPGFLNRPETSSNHPLMKTSETIKESGLSEIGEVKGMEPI